MMNQFLKWFRWLRNFLFSFMNGIPNTFDSEERILRVLYLPKHLSKDEKSIKPGAFRPPAGKDEVSVVRLEYSSADFCKEHGKKHADPPERIYFGFAIIKVNEIRSVIADIIFTPLPVGWPNVTTDGRECT